VVKGKTRLNVLVMFTPQFHSFGPHSFNPKYVWKYYGYFCLGSERGSANSGDSIRNSLNTSGKWAGPEAAPDLMISV